MAIISKAIIHSAVAITITENPEGGAIGTGFLLLDQARKGEDQQVHGRGWVATCAHVTEQVKKQRPDGVLFIVMNDGKNKEKVIPHQLDWWTRHREWKGMESESHHDVAVAPIAAEMLEGSIWQVWWEETSLNKEQMEENEIWEGNRVLTLGFPSGINMEIERSVKSRVWPLLGQGVIARIGPWFEGSANTFMIEGGAYPGQSGSPVITYPELMHMTKGAAGVPQSRLIGMLCERTLARGQSPEGLETGAFGRVVGMNEIWDTIEFWRERHPGLHTDARTRAEQ